MESKKKLSIPGLGFFGMLLFVLGVILFYNPAEPENIRIPIDDIKPKSIYSEV